MTVVNRNVGKRSPKLDMAKLMIKAQAIEIGNYTHAIDFRFTIRNCCVLIHRF